MYTGNKNQTHPHSFHHSMKDGASHYFDRNHFLGIDPLDHTKFHHFYEPPVNVKEDFHSYELEMMIPGFKKENITIAMEDDRIIVSGKKDESVSSSNMSYIHSEHVVNEFRRDFFLSKDAEPDKIEAKFENGVLRISLTKITKNKTLVCRQIPIQ